VKRAWFYLLLGLIGISTLSCRMEYEAPVPYNFSDTPGSGKFTPAIRGAVNGVYTVSEGADRFGNQVALRWTYTHDGADTVHSLSVFTGVGAGFFSLEINQMADSMAVRGFWRKLVNEDTGLANFVLKAKRNGQLQPYTGQLLDGDTLVVDGYYDTGTGSPQQKITLTYLRPLNPAPFEVIAHRGGGRTSDLLSASENSLRIIRLASRLGAHGVELDVQYTKDSIPVLYHDNKLNLRLVQKNGLSGTINQYTYQQLKTFVRLINGEEIPTLEQALQTIVDNTSLDFVWLDSKFEGPMARVQALQQRYNERAKQSGRNLRIVIGLPSTEAIQSYQGLASKSNTPILCELDTTTTRGLGANIWAPRWTLGPQTEEVKAMKAEGRSVFVWTLDETQFIERFIGEGEFDGILSNYSPVVAYYHYTAQ
jgi:glycerophosphoryl diester phosphodiesterase